MLTSKDLMIGDYCKYTKGNYTDIRQIQLLDIEMYCEGIIFLEPIPLTAEILEKNGWKKDTGGEEVWGNSKCWFTPHEYGKRDTIKSWEVEICGKPNSFDGVIKYTYQLQHALRLCGIKHEIKL